MTGTVGPWPDGRAPDRVARRWGKENSVHLRRTLSRPATLAVASLALLVAACGASAPAANADPYQLATKTFDASWEQVKIQLGISGTDGKTNISIPPEAIQFSFDTTAGKAAIHLAIPTSALGDSASSLAMLGVTGDTVGLDVVYDGQALYAKSQLAAGLLPMLLAQSGQEIPSGDLSGWLKLGTAADFAGLLGSLGAMPSPVASPSFDPSTLDPAALKAELEKAGVVLAYAGSENKNGVDADHLTVALDFTKLAASEFAASLPADRKATLTEFAGKATMTADMWLDRGSGRLAQFDLHAAETGGSGKFDLSILVNAPDPNAFVTPSGATELPIAPLLEGLMQSGLIP
jgi:hypothetical protein